MALCLLGCPLDKGGGAGGVLGVRTGCLHKPQSAANPPCYSDSGCV